MPKWSQFVLTKLKSNARIIHVPKFGKEKERKRSTKWRSPWSQDCD